LGSAIDTATEPKTTRSVLPRRVRWWLVFVITYLLTCIGVAPYMMIRDSLLEVDTTFRDQMFYLQMTEQDNRRVWSSIEEARNKKLSLQNADKTVHPITEWPKKDDGYDCPIWIGCQVLGHDPIWVSSWQGFCSTCGVRLVRH